MDSVIEYTKIQEPNIYEMKNTSETGRSELYDISIAIEKRMKEEKGLIPNVDFFSATVYHSMDIPTIYSRQFRGKSYIWLDRHILEQYRIM